MRMRRINVHACATNPVSQAAFTLTVVSRIHIHARQDQPPQQRQVSIKHSSAQHRRLLHRALVAVQTSSMLQRQWEVGGDSLRE
jgi:hypothetical protein